MQIVVLQTFIGNECASGEGKVKGNSFFKMCRSFKKYLCAQIISLPRNEIVSELQYS